MDTHSRIEWLSPAEIESPLHQRAGDEVRISSEWKVDRFVLGQGDGLGTWRVSGTMTTPKGEAPWSMVPKGWDCGTSPGSPSAFDWPRREAELYGSGFLNELHGVRAPTCFATVNREDSVWVWLEDLTGVPQQPWELDHYATAAHYLGQFNGTYLDGNLTADHPSLSQQWLAGWAAANTHTMANLDLHLEHPFVQRMLSADILAAYRRIWDQRHAILIDLGSMPQTLCHLDAYHQNTFFRDRDGHEEMVLIDWSFAG